MGYRTTSLAATPISDVSKGGPASTVVARFNRACHYRWLERTITPDLGDSGHGVMTNDTTARIQPAQRRVSAGCTEHTRRVAGNPQGRVVSISVTDN